MAKSEFLRNVMTARNFLVHGDQLKKDPGVGSAHAPIWLTPSSVKGFDVREFSELSSESQEELRTSVDRFLLLAKQASTEKTTTADQMSQAAEAFLKVLQILLPYLPAGGEMTTIRGALQSVGFPEDVLTWDFELGTDSTGDPAVWVWVVVSDATPKRRDFRQVTSEIERKIREVLLNTGSNRWPFVRFRTASEQRAL